MSFGPAYDIDTLPEAQFFSTLRSGGNVGNTFPLPEGIQCWDRGSYNGEKVLVAYREEHLYLIADADKIGLALFHYVFDPENDAMYRYARVLPTRVINTERRIISMNSAMNNEMRDLASTMRANRGMGVMSLGQGAADMPPMNMGVTGDGLGGSGVTLRNIQREALAKSQVTGYIMATAPAITLSVQKTKGKDLQPAYVIRAKESKPSRCLSVLLRVPKRCVSRANGLADPSEILNCAVDFNTISPDEFVCYNQPIEAAVGYICALGGTLAENAVTVAGEREPWAPDAILSNREGVSYVIAKPVENKRRTSSSASKFNFNLKSTSPRRSLYTQGNHVCLRAVEHIDIKCNSEQDAYNLNEMAFGTWRYRQPKNQAMNNLDKAISECPSQIWAKKYTIDGKEVDGVGSVFFMAGNEEVNGAGEKVMKRQLTYFPWYQTGNLRPQNGQKLTRMVKRTLSEGDGEKKTRMVTHPVYYKNDPRHPMFAPYANFVSYILSEGYITADALNNMGGRSSKKSNKVVSYTPEQMESIKAYLRSSAVKDAVQIVQDEAADRAILNNR